MVLKTRYVDSEFFKVDRYELTGKNVIQNDNPFMMVSITEGSGTLEENKVKKEIILLFVLIRKKLFLMVQWK